VSTFTTYSYTNENLTNVLNQGKDILAAGLADEGLIDIVLAEKIATEYALVVRKRNFFGRLLDRMWKKDKDGIRVAFVKVIETRSLDHMWEHVDDVEEDLPG